MASIKSSALLPAMGCELIILIDELGTELHIQIPISQEDQRQAIIDQHKQEMDDRVAALRSYATKHGLEIR
jgi:hypothetical protein